MIECIFTLDYEIYGNGKGSLRELVIDPTRRLAEICHEFGAPFVVFAEAVEFARIEGARCDRDIEAVRAQMRELRSAGHEIALHLHPWWANARYQASDWQLDWTERSIGTLPPDRIQAIISMAIAYLRDALQDPYFTPLSFRSGLWVMQPTPNIANALVRHGIRLDSSVFKGGRIRSLQLDYRPSMANPAFWRFAADVNVPDDNGKLWEIPIYTEMVPFWRMLGRKRLAAQRRVPAGSNGMPLVGRWRDFLRFRYPRKLDFCRMTFEQMRAATQTIIDKLQRQSGELSPFVVIGHSKDFVDGEAIRRFLEFLGQNAIKVTTFSRLLGAEARLSC